jgi:hypothetical protein
MASARNMIGAGARKLIERGLEAEGRSVTVADMDRMTADFIAYYADNIAVESRPFEGLEAALDRRAPRREYPRKLDGEREARLVAVACSAPPTGYERWSLRLLADELVRLEVVEAVSHETVRRTLQQTT